MSDMIDRAQELEQMQRDDALAVASRRPIVGCICCIECGNPIAPVRTALGAKRCIECQQAFEAEAKRARMPRS